MLSETERGKYCVIDIIYMWNQKIMQTNVYIKQKQIHIHRKHTVTKEMKQDGQIRGKGLTDTNQYV